MSSCTMKAINKNKKVSDLRFKSIVIGVTSMSPGSAQLASLQQSGSVKLEFEMASINHSCTSAGGGLDVSKNYFATFAFERHRFPTNIDM